LRRSAITTKNPLQRPPREVGMASGRKPWRRRSSRRPQRYPFRGDPERCSSPPARGHLPGLVEPASSSATGNGPRLLPGGGTGRAEPRRGLRPRRRGVRPAQLRDLTGHPRAGPGEALCRPREAARRRPRGGGERVGARGDSPRAPKPPCLFASPRMPPASRCRSAEICGRAREGRPSAGLRRDPLTRTRSGVHPDGRRGCFAPAGHADESERHADRKFRVQHVKRAPEVLEATARPCAPRRPRRTPTPRAR
jgi:hypothetical protein